MVNYLSVDKFHHRMHQAFRMEEEALYCPKKSALADAVRSQKADDLPRLHGKADIFQQDMASMTAGEMFHGQHYVPALLCR